MYEDALTILSYASPYDVQLEIERVPEKSRALPNTPSGSKRLGSCSFNNSGQKLFHPLYRSQSIDDLTQIDKDTFPSHGLGPRRSQSVGVAAHKLAAHFKNSDSKLEDKDRNPSSLMLSTTGSLNEKMLANVMADGNIHKNGLQWEKRFEDTLESEDSGSNNDTQITNIDVSKNSNKSSILKVSRSATENVSDSSDEVAHTTQNFKQNIKYLDSPHQRGKLEAFKSSTGEKSDTTAVASDHLKTGRAKTMADASNALWHLDQSIKDGDTSISEFDGSQNSSWTQSKREDLSHTKISTPIMKNNKFAKRDDDNDSDVSNDSLEQTNKKRTNKKSKKATCSVHLNEMVKDEILTQETRNLHGKTSNSIHKQNFQQKISKKHMQHNEAKNKSKSEANSKTEYNINSERVYANNIMNKSISMHNNSSCTNDDQKVQSSDREGYQDSKNLETHHEKLDAEHKESTSYINHRDAQDNLSNRNTQKITINDSSNNYGKVNGRNAYGERQKLSSSENYSQNYGCTNRITINGSETDDLKNKFIANSKTTFAQKSTASSYQTSQDDRSDTDTRYLDKNKSNVNQKFVKKSPHPAGMFTQINPFQQPSRQKNANFKIWTSRDDIKDSAINGNEPNYSATVSGSYILCDSSHSNQRDYISESPNYGQRIGDVTKTVLISSYDNSGRSISGAQNSPLNYRPQHK